MNDFQEEIASGVRRRQLTVLRDTLAEALYDLRSSIKAHEGLCRRCGGSLSEAGLASLAQRLMQVLDAIEELGSAEHENTPLDTIRSSLYGDAATGGTGTDDSSRTDLGTKRAQRRQGGRRTS